MVLINKKNTARYSGLCDQILYRQLPIFFPNQMSIKGLKICPKPSVTHLTMPYLKAKNKFFEQSS